MRRAFLWLACLTFAISGIAPSLAATLDEILKAGVIRIGVNPTLPPRALYNDKNEIDGFEPEIAREIARKLGVKLELVAVGSPDRIPFVASGKIDAVMGSLSRTSWHGWRNGFSKTDRRRRWWGNFSRNPTNTGAGTGRSTLRASRNRNR